ncbi:DNA recombination protein RmuC [Oscillochloris sp. ZM17-4]|uniref:DNA recombination protein RmuC n=1 Tax=Oscillochloris sp. ZM17-4 TaxID=2866714 RepID=UPI001C72B3F7|nr:DNA recombination protein RmuC [Oscillochloris sp. ZM17-4]MBX0331541.1 DNA recombination protein RmuC [Oscillochloris sp. ZM17-4]
MDITLIILSSAASAALAALITWLIAGRRAQAERERAIRAETALEAANRAHAEKIGALQDAEQRMRDAFASLSGEALKASNEQFLQLAEERMQRQQQAAKSDLTSLVEPLRETLTRQEQQVKALEEARQAAYGGLDEVLRGLRQDQQSLRTQTDALTQSLRNPKVRGRWGEIQLRRLIELAGMLNHCDFEEQQSTTDADQKRQRPDLLVQLPNQRQIIVDAKVPLDRFLDALEAPEDQRSELFRQHARSIRGHVDEMAKRAYHKQFSAAHEFTVIFIPGEVFYQVALEHDHELLEYALTKNIILASPNTLIAVLKSAAMGWKETQLAADAQKIQQIGAEVYDRLNIVAGHLGKLGKNLTQSVSAYNDTVGSIESRLLASARKMHTMGVGNADLPEIASLGDTVRAISQPELLGEPAGD